MQFDTDLGLKAHAEEGNDQQNNGKGLFPLGYITVILFFLYDNIRCILIARQQGTKYGRQKDCGDNGERKSNLCKFEHAELLFIAEFSHRGVGNYIDHRTNQCDGAAHARADGDRHHQLGPAGAGLFADTHDDGHHHSCYASIGQKSGQQGRHQANHQNLGSLRLGKLQKEMGDIMGKPGGKDCLSDNQECADQNHIGVGEAGYSFVGFQEAS